MRILIEEDGKKVFKFVFPNKLIFNRLTAAITAIAIEKHNNLDILNLELSGWRRLFKEINRIKRKFPHLELVDVETHDGDKVKITL